MDEKKKRAWFGKKDVDKHNFSILADFSVKKSYEIENKKIPQNPPVPFKSSHRRNTAETVNAPTLDPL